MSYSDEFIKIMDYIGNKIGVAIDWTSQNLMPYFTELMERVVRYKIMTSIAWICIAIILFLVFFSILKAAIKKHIDPDVLIAFKLLFIFISIMGFFIITTQVFNIIEAINIPEMTFYNYVQSISYKFN